MALECRWSGAGEAAKSTQIAASDKGGGAPERPRGIADATRHKKDFS